MKTICRLNLNKVEFTYGRGVKMNILKSLMILGFLNRVYNVLEKKYKI